MIPTPSRVNDGRFSPEAIHPQKPVHAGDSHVRVKIEQTWTRRISAKRPGAIMPNYAENTKMLGRVDCRHLDGRQGSNPCSTHGESRGPYARHSTMSRVRIIVQRMNMRDPAALCNSLHCAATACQANRGIITFIPGGAGKRVFLTRAPGVCAPPAMYRKWQPRSGEGNARR